MRRAVFGRGVEEARAAHRPEAVRGGCVLNRAQERRVEGAAQLGLRQYRRRDRRHEDLSRLRRDNLPRPVGERVQQEARVDEKSVRVAEVPAQERAGVAPRPVNLHARTVVDETHAEVADATVHLRIECGLGRLHAVDGQQGILGLRGRRPSHGLDRVSIVTDSTAGSVDDRAGRSTCSTESAGIVSSWTRVHLGHEALGEGVHLYVGLVR